MNSRRRAPRRICFQGTCSALARLEFDACLFLRKLVALSAPVAQLDRASDYGSEGLKFESSRVRHIPGRLSHMSPFPGAQIPFG